MQNARANAGAQTSCLPAALIPLLGPITSVGKQPRILVDMFQAMDKGPAVRLSWGDTRLVTVIYVVKDQM